MGRAIEMESKIDHLDARLKKAEDALERVINVVDSMQEKSSKVKPVKEKKNVSKEKANDEGNGKSSK